MQQRSSPRPLFRIRKLCAAGAVLFFLLPWSLQAAGVSSVLTTPDAVTVSRGDFIRAAVKSLHVSLDTTVTLPYRRVPAGLVPYIKTAYAANALETFGENLLPAQGITRGQALEVLVALSGLSAEPATGYTDLKGASDRLARAVQAAVDKQWMDPESSKVFGVREPLTGSEARILLRKVTGEGGEQDQQNTEEAPPAIHINLKSVSAQPLGDLPKAQMLEALWKIISDDYLHADKINQDSVAYDAADAIVKSLNDPYSTFYRPAKALDFQTRLNGEVSGIGAQVEERDGILTIVTPLTGSPAAKAGLQPGDQILAVDGVSLAGIPYEEAVGKVRGPVGSIVRLHIRRSGNELDVSVVRATIKVPEVDISWQGDIAIVRILQFGKITESDLRGALQDVQKQQPIGLILDLRNNPGGFLHAADVVASNFLPKGSPVVEIRSRSGDRTDVTDQAPTIAADVPVVVLVNKGSASASEIVAGALQDANRATIVGEQSFGKGTVQEVLEFADHSSLKLTIAEWFTPKGRKIDGIGVKPDVSIPLGDRDEQLRKALEILQGGRR